MSVRSAAGDPIADEYGGARSLDAEPDHGPIYRRILRREQSVSRSTAASIVAVIVLIVALAVIACAGAALLHERIGEFDPRHVAAAVQTAPRTSAVWVFGIGGAAAVVLGLILLALGVLPHRRGRRRMRSERVAVLIDDEVLASALARAARSRTRLGPEAVVASVGRRSADVVLRPPAGLDVPSLAANTAVEAELDAILPEPAVQTRLRVVPTGRVGG